jgi:hypothetical protein
MRIALGQLEDPALLTALRRTQLNRPTAPLGKRLRERRVDLSPYELALHDQQRWD